MIDAFSTKCKLREPAVVMSVEEVGPDALEVRVLHVFFLSNGEVAERVDYGNVRSKLDLPAVVA